MKIYLASRYSRYEEMQGYAATLTDLGHIVTSRWILGDHDIRAHGQSDADHFMALWAVEDMTDLLEAEFVISFTEPPQEVPGRRRGGRHVEMGIALATDKRCIVIGYRENVFHWLACIEYYESWEQYLAVLERDAEGAHD